VTKSVTNLVFENPGFLRGVALFNQGRFYDAHEVWEDVWREHRGPEKSLLQGLIQVAVGLHHFGQGNLPGARSLLRRGHKRLDEYPDEFPGLEVRALKQQIGAWQEALAGSGPYPPFPRLGGAAGATIPGA